MIPTATTSKSYIPRYAHQPRGTRPWCAGCDTDAHLLLESPAVPGRLAGILAVAVNCSKCRRSRVLETTAEYMAALPHACPRHDCKEYHAREQQESGPDYEPLRVYGSQTHPYQIDGEVKSVDADTLATIECAPSALATLG